MQQDTPNTPTMSPPTNAFVPGNFTSPSPIMTPPRAWKKPIGIVAGVVVGVGVIAGGVFAYQYYYPSPKTVLTKMATATANIKAFRFSAVADVKTTTTAPKIDVGFPFPENFVVNTSGAVDVRDTKSPALDLTISGNATVGGDQIPAGVNVRYVGSMLYLRLNDAPNVGPIDLSFLKGQWIKIDVAAMLKQFGVDLSKATTKGSPPSIEDINTIRQVLLSSNVFTITATLPSENIAGVGTYHYAFTIDKQQVMMVMGKIAEVLNKKPLDATERADLQKSLNAIDSISGELWIGKTDFYVRQVKYTLVVKETPESKWGGTVIETIQLSNYNTPDQIVAPTPVKPIEEIIGPFMQSVLGGGALGSLPPVQ